MPRRKSYWPWKKLQAMIILFLEIFCFFFSHVTIIQTSSTGNIWTITRAYRTSKKPSKRGSMYILIVFLFSPPSLLIFIRLSSTWNTLTLYFYQPTTSRRWGTIHVIDLHPPARFFIAAARSCVHGTFHTDHRSICWTRSSLLRKKKKKTTNRYSVTFTIGKKKTICTHVKSFC